MINKHTFSFFILQSNIQCFGFSKNFSQISKKAKLIRMKKFIYILIDESIFFINKSDETFFNNHNFIFYRSCLLALPINQNRQTGFKLLLISLLRRLKIYNLINRFFIFDLYRYFLFTITFLLIRLGFVNLTIFYPYSSKKFEEKLTKIFYRFPNFLNFYK